MQYFKLTKKGIRWDVKKGQVHTDDVEMSSFGVSFTVKYGCDAYGKPVFGRTCAFPSLRTIPNNTHGTLKAVYEGDDAPMPMENGNICNEKALSFSYDGILTAVTKTKSLRITRSFYPAYEKKAGIERITVENISDAAVEFSLSLGNDKKLGEVKGCKGIYHIRVLHNAFAKLIRPKEKYTFGIYYCAEIVGRELPFVEQDREYRLRRNRVKKLMYSVRIESGNEKLDRMFAFAALRAGDSIFHTLTGDYHSPGGGPYYAATWCNDQVEYVGPWAAVTGDETQINAAVNAYVGYTNFMSDSYTRIPCSIISEGLDIWEGAKDRGDAAMYMYGASLFLLSVGKCRDMDKIWKGVKWCAEYCRRNTTSEGVIRSDTDELENRIPTDGYANLSTSCLCLGGLKAASAYASRNGESDYAAELTKRASELEKSIERYYGAELHGFSTYRYSKGFDTLRSWICLPLVMGISNRTKGTVDALMSDFLWNGSGTLSCELGNENSCGATWDRSTLYTFRGVMIAGETDRIWDKFLSYVDSRLLGERVPYAVEAYPENNMRHLSGESALFCRAVLEGLLGMHFDENGDVAFAPHLPSGMRSIKISGLKICGKEICADFTADAN